MIICPAKRLVFVHIVKTAGSSLTALLAPHTVPALRAAEDGRLEGHNWQADWHFKGGQHTRYCDHADALTALVPGFADFTVLCVVRNPYDWLVSVYRDFYTGKIWRRQGPRAKFAQRYPNQTLPDFLDYMAARRNSGITGDAPQWRCVEGIPEQRLEVVKFENLSAGLLPVLAAHGIRGKLPVRNQKPASAERAAWRRSPGLIAWCNDHFAGDFSAFGYAME